MKTLHTINTDFDFNTGLITQELINSDPVNLQDECERLAVWTCNTRDAGIRKALVELGWTPPKEDKPKPSELHRTVMGHRHMAFANSEGIKHEKLITEPSEPPRPPKPPKIQIRGVIPNDYYNRFD